MLRIITGYLAPLSPFFTGRSSATHTPPQTFVYETLTQFLSDPPSNARDEKIGRLLFSAAKESPPDISKLEVVLAAIHNNQYRESLLTELGEGSDRIQGRIHLRDIRSDIATGRYAHMMNPVYHVIQREQERTPEAAPILRVSFETHAFQIVIEVVS